MNKRYAVQDIDGGWRGFNITDTITNTTTTCTWAWFGANTNMSKTWDFADTGELMEVERDRFNDFRQALHQDDSFANLQLLMNRRLEQWHAETENKGITEHSLHQVCWSCWDANTSENFTITSDIHYGFDVPWSRRFRYYHNPILSKIARVMGPVIDRLDKILKFNRSAEEIQMEKAQKKAEKLLRVWLTEDEYRYLNSPEGMEIVQEDEIYIVKRKGAMVEAKKEEAKYCVISKDHVAEADETLTKIMMIKTDINHFKKKAQRYGS